MRYILLITCCVLLVACGPTAAPTPNVPALQTQAAALNAVATVRAALIVPTLPPAQATQSALILEYFHLVMAQGHTTDPAARTPLALTITAVEATLTALPTRMVP
jgi:hypothetical protein